MVCTAQKERRTRCKGFTLVEVLVTIIIMGILAGAMMLTRQGGDTMAEATRIINDLRVMKASAMVFMIESGDFIPVNNVNYDKHLGKYI